MERPRDLTFESFDDARQELELLSQGHEQHGKWNLSQCCKHCNYWLSYPMDGFPPAPIFIRPLMFLVKTFIGKSMLKNILAKGFSPGGPTAPDTVTTGDETPEAESIKQLRETMERFEKYDGPIHPSPIFGKLDYETAKRLQLRHLAHHFGFLTPK